MRLATITLDVIVGAINKGPFNAGTGTMANFEDELTNLQS